MDIIEARHRQEKKDLQAKTQKIKHAAPKGDKKRQREAKEEIARLEAELQEKHRQELEVAQQSTVTQCEDGVGDMNLSEKDLAPTENSNGDNAKSTKKSKAAKRREKKEREEKEREARIAAGKEESLTGARHVEQQLLDTKLKQKSLTLYDIPSDGDCLYKAIAHQISLTNNQPAMLVADVRSKVANEMREHIDDYLPFITTPAGDMLDEQGYLDYCDKLEKTPEWGGHVEIKAVNALFGYPVHVIQSDMPDVIIDHDTNEGKPPLTVVYHKRLYELGEHYNSVIPIKDPTDS